MSGPALPDAFLRVPLAHRAYHDKTDRRPENSRAAFGAAIEAGYGIECDVQLTADNEAVVFHDYDLGRLTGERGPVRGRSAAELARIALTHGDETIPTLHQMLELVGGRVPLLIEVKDQDGAMGPDVGPLEHAVANALAGYGGPVALMSFNPHSVAALAGMCPEIPRGLTTSAYTARDWTLLNDETRERLRRIPDYDRTGSAFISHEAPDLDRRRVTELRAGGAKILCWTIRSAEAEARARQVAHNITFEGFAARIAP